MAEVYFERSSQLEEYLMEKLGVSEDDAANCLGDLEDYEEESYKRSTRCSGYFKDNLNNVYYSLTYTADYDYGSSDFYLDTTPLKKTSRIVEQEVIEYVAVEGKTND